MQEEILQQLKESGIFKEVELTNHCRGEDDCLSIEYYGDDPTGEKRFIKELLRNHFPHWRIEKIDEDGPRTIVVFHERPKL